MDKRGFNYEKLLEDSECPFCGSFAAERTSVCNECGAVHGTVLPGIGAFMIFLALFFSGIAGIFTGLEYKSGIVGWGVFIVAGLSSAIFMGKSFTRKGWFR